MYIYVQMRRVVCERLASLVHVNVRTASNARNISVDKPVCDVDVPNNINHHDLTAAASSSSAAAVAEHDINPSIERLLSSMKDMLETRLHSDSQLRQQTDENQEMMREWMIAAAVIDRICFIVFSIALVVSSLIFALLLFFHA